MHDSEGRIIGRAEAASFPQTGAVPWDQEVAEAVFQDQLDRDASLEHSLPFTDEGEES